MRKILMTILLLSFICCKINAGKLSVTDEYNDEQSRILTTKVSETTVAGADGGYGLKMKVLITFTSFAVGWQASTRDLPAGLFNIKYRVHKDEKGWTEWKTDEGYVSPDQNKHGIYKSDLLFGHDEQAHDSIEFYIYPPGNEIITELYVTLLNISKTISIIDPNLNGTLRSGSCPEFPTMIPRSAWCGTPACINPSYIPTYRPNMTHTVIHHGASPNSYTDGASVVRSYWNYHAISLGWGDIGYNYLFDKYGNFYQGRHNPQLLNNDVHAAHAGNTNTYSIGCNFLGDTDSPGTAPTQAQLEKCSQFLAWWYNKKGFDPLSSASILRQNDNIWATIPRICGHRDVNIGGTACPGNALQAFLPFIRTRTAQIIQCNDGDTEPPTTNIVIEKEWNNSNFEALFEDVDNPGGSGVNTAFWQVIDFDGYRNNSFFFDDFSAQPNENWKVVSGNWNFNSGTASINSTVTNTNAYTAVNQPTGKIFLYQWKMKFNASGSNTRAGIHFFCSDASLEHRGLSYMVYFREHNNKTQIYKYNSAGTFVLHADDDTNITAGIWYDIKVVFNSNNGKIDVYKDNVLVSTWTDPSPYLSGNHVSLRAGECNVSFDDFSVFMARNEKEIVTVGQNAYIQNESKNNSTPAGKINTILIDNAKNWSQLYSKNVFVDQTPPLTHIVNPDNWQTEDFEVDFDEQDLLSGIDKRYYQSIDFDGNKWSANTNFGFATDNFQSLDNWTNALGNWSVEDGKLIQSDESVNNTNLYLALKQQEEEYLYEFDLKIEGSGTNRRGGFHYFSDNPTATERGNGYFIFFRLESRKLEFYKVRNNVFSQEKVVDANINFGEWNNIKISFNKNSGITQTYINNVFAASYKDENPYVSGNYVSFRTGNSNMAVRNFNVYKSRTSRETITIGENKEIRFQNDSPENPSAKIITFTIDNAGNFSNAVSKKFNIDWTAPIIGDNISVDLSGENDLYTITANWDQAIDKNSGINHYLYSVGTTQGGSDIVNWTESQVTNTSFEISNFVFQEDTDYYFNVKAENGAGLMSGTISEIMNIPEIVYLSNSKSINNINIYPNPNTGKFTIFYDGKEKLNIDIIDITGKTVLREKINSTKEINLKLTTGVYFLKMYNEKETVVRELLVK